MAGINFLGSYSGIDQSTIDKLMYYEKLPLKQLDARKSAITTQKDAWKDVNTRLNSLYNRLKDLQDPSTFNSMTAKVGSDKNILSATASKDAVSGRYDIKVAQLATNARIQGAQVKIEGQTTGAGVDEKLGFSGSLVLNGSDTDTPEERAAKTISVGADDTLRTISKKINDQSKETGVSATVIDSRLVLTDSKTGGKINISGSDDFLKNLGLKEGEGDFKSEGGQQAKFTINGIEMERDSNTVTDAVLGLTINLNKADPDYIETITVGGNTEKLTKAIQDFVDQYNSTLSFIQEQTAAGTVSSARNADGMYETSGRGALAGDSALRGLQDSLRMMTTSGFGNGGINNIAQLGMTTSSDRSGRLSFNASKFLEEFEKDPAAVQNFFSKEEIVDGKNVSTGFVSNLNNRIDSYISTKDGIIKGRSESLDRTLKDINDRIEVFNERISRKEEYYIKRFAALDTAMMQAESQMEWLQGQIAAMNAQVRSK